MAGPGGVEEGRVSIRVVPDLTDFAPELRTKLVKIQESVKVSIPTELNTDGLSEHLKLKVAELNALSPNIRIGTDIDSSQVSTIEKGLSGVAREASGAAGSISTMGTALAIAALAAAAVAPALAVALPIAVGIGGAIAVIVLAFKGLKAVFAPLIAGFKTLQAPITAIVTDGIGPLVKAFTVGLIPVLKVGLGQAAGIINQVLKAFLKLGSSTEFLSGLAAVMKGASDAFQPLVATIPLVARAFGQIAVAALPALKGLSKGFAGVLTSFSTSIANLAKSGQLADIISNAADALAAFGKFGGKAFLALLSAGTQLAPVFTAVLGALTPLVDQLSGPLFPAVSAIVTAFSRLAVAALPLVIQILDKAVPLFAQFATTIGGALLSAITALTPQMPAIVKAITALVAGVVQAAPSFAKLVAKIAPLIPQIVDLALKYLPPLIGAVIAVAGFVGNLVGKVQSAVSWFDTFARKLGGAVSSALDTAKGKIGDLVGFVKDLPGKIKTALGDIASKFMSVGSDIISGIVTGIKSVAGHVADAALGAVKGALDKVNIFNDSHSPSRLWRDEVGLNMALGVRDGLELGAPQIASAAIKAVAPPDVLGDSVAPTSGARLPGVTIGTVTVADVNEMANVLAQKQRDAAVVENLQLALV